MRELARPARRSRFPPARTRRAARGPARPARAVAAPASAWRPRWGHRLALLGVAVVLAGAVRRSGWCPDAVEGVGYLDEPTVAPDGVHVVAVVRGGLWAPPGAADLEQPDRRHRGRVPLRRRRARGGGAGLVARRAQPWPSAPTTAASPSAAADTLAAMRSLAGYRGSFRATGIGWSPDGTRLAAVDGTGTLQVWRAEDGALVGATPVFTTYTGRVAWSPRSDAVAVHCDDASELAVVEVSGGGRGPGAAARRARTGEQRRLGAGRDGAGGRVRGEPAPRAVPARRRGLHRAGRRPAGRPHRCRWPGPRTGRRSRRTSPAPSGDGVVRVFDGRTGAPTGRFPGARRCSRTRCGRRAATASRSPTAPGSSRGPCTARPRAGGRARSSPTVPACSPGPPTAACSRPAAATTPCGCGAPDGGAGRRVGGQPLGDAAAPRRARPAR